MKITESGLFMANIIHQYQFISMDSGLKADRSLT